MAIKTRKVLFADIEAMEKKGWVTTNEWSIKDYYVIMERAIKRTTLPVAENRKDW